MLLKFDTIGSRQTQFLAMSKTIETLSKLKGSTTLKGAASRENLSYGFPTRSYTNQAVQTQKMARGLKLHIKEVEEMLYLCSENKGAEQLCGYCRADLRLCFRICKNRFSHNAAYMKLEISLMSNIISDAIILFT